MRAARGSDRLNPGFRSALGRVFTRGSRHGRYAGTGHGLRDDRDRRIHFVSGANRLLDLVNVRKRFENEHITPAVLECLELLSECRPCFIETGGTEWLEPNAERTNGAGDEEIVLSDLACELRRRAVYLGETGHG